jgi:predicted DNA-binding transcriptional regulator YafY
MATNKNALLRYNTLDKCFKNFYRKYYFEDLLEIVNQALKEEDPDTSGILVRQLRDDIRFMRSEAGYSAPIEAFKEGKKAYYQYSNKSFSINNSPLNETEIQQMKNALSLLQRFEGSEGFEWISEISTKLKDNFSINKEPIKVVSFENNIDYLGACFISPLFNFIVNKTVLKIKYKPFNKDEHEVVFHPYFLKQYNNRWFVLGLNQELGIETWNFALDRILEINPITEKYINSRTDWEYHFSQIIGVTKPNDLEEEIIELIFNEEIAPYIETKPLHQSQFSKRVENGLYVRFKLIPNYELEQIILSYGEKVKVLSPSSLYESIKHKLEKAFKQYL